MTHQILWHDDRGTDFETSPGFRGLSRAPLRKTEEGAKMKEKCLPLSSEISCQSNHFFLPFTFQFWRHGQLPGPRAASGFRKVAASKGGNICPTSFTSSRALKTSEKFRDTCSM
ncbi:hypothetical protein AVEN_116767-1 [Araneus ventricosus]|uniref:Uncharacterized protein n=1 Tax=Araneus ventricosus TaxID=182803 RepID=A0A4Y2D6I9_ARAVE|nr:hypothetical protein AVEN_116767-1 [Araneus ventricosus]